VTPQPLRLRLLLERLREAEIDFVLVGGLAVNAWGYLPLATPTSIGLSVKVCSLDDLLAMKRAGDRPRDREDLEALEAAREGREPGPG
jgi:hypothetical protein